MAGSSKADMDRFADGSMLLQVSNVFPDIESDIIRKDLSFTHSAEQTINRILDGTIIQSSPQKNNSSGSYACSSTDINSDSDLDLPPLKLKVNPRCPPRGSYGNASKYDNDVIDLSQDDHSDTDVNSDSDPELPDLDNPTGKHNNDESNVDSSNQIENISAAKTREKNNYNLKKTSNTHTHTDTSHKCNANLCSSETACDLAGDPSSKMVENDFRPNFSVHISDDSDEDYGPLTNRLGLAERCGLGAKSRLFTKVSSAASDSKVAQHERDASDSFGSVQGVKRKSNILVDSNQADHNCEDVPQKKAKKKRSPEEIAESKRLAEEKRAERVRALEDKKAQKQRESDMKKALQENKRHYRAGDCVKYLTVSVDPGVINSGQLGAGIFKACGDLGAKCVTEPQFVPNTITWKREVLDCSQATAVKKEVVEEDVLAVIPTHDFVSMVTNYTQMQQGLGQAGAMTVRDYIQTLQSVYAGKAISVFVMGKEKYFSDLKLSNKRNHREAVLNVGGGDGQRPRKTKKGGSDRVISRVEMEEALIDAQLHTNCIVQFAETSQDAADLVKSFTKAVADKPAKRDRLENVFDFLAEGAAGVKVDKNGNGLLKVWKHQLLQFKNVGPDMAEAIIAVYPSPRLLYEAYKSCTTEKEAQKLLENIVVRRGAGVLVTNRRIGKELSRKIHSLFTSTDSEFIIK
ncbi:crossover junction endonuclease EME1-like isoform X1 [Haliotis rufescens]|uniref:crossover junction endonuclease EME1-like isoform X1 n=2 Tax=Haliotis rufescens TaxID=6454 RepID=UPI00201F76F9|nr:crossover junction endonuclease EME1-like isoform X1 [Haliotis rufescens]